MILFRDTLANGGTRLPAWLDGLDGLYRIPFEGGDVVTMTEPLYVPLPTSAGLRWHDLGDGWQTAMAGKDVGQTGYLRVRTDLAAAVVADRSGSPWSVPRVADREGASMLPLPWGRDESGVRARRPTDEQAKLLAIAAAAAGELRADRFLSVPLDVLASWVHPLIEATYHLTGDVLDALGLCDDLLGVRVVLAAIGWGQGGSDG